MAGFAPSAWCDALAAHTQQTVVLHPPREFFAFLRTDGIFAGGPVPHSCLSDSDDVSDDELSASSLERESNPETLFPEFHAQITAAIRTLGGACVPKLGVSTPKDALWMTAEHTLRCSAAHQVYQLLKASDRVALELASHGEGGDYAQPELALRAWDPRIDVAREFRVFVSDARALAVCQRNDTVHYPHLSVEAPAICARIVRFCASLRDVLPWTVPFVLDVHIGVHTGNVTIIDAAPWDPRACSAILFTWDELFALRDNSGIQDSPEPLFRAITSESECRIGYARQNAMPVDWEALLAADAFRPVNVNEPER